jgi:hypothetical protein
VASLGEGRGKADGVGGRLLEEGLAAEVSLVAAEKLSPRPSRGKEEDGTVEAAEEAAATDEAAVGRAGAGAGEALLRHRSGPGLTADGSGGRSREGGLSGKPPGYQTGLHDRHMIVRRLLLVS